MRLRSDIFVSALLRRVFSAGGFAAVEQRGAEQAGAIFIRHRFRDGTEDLYGPAPQMLADDDGERRFERRLQRVEAPDVDTLIARERRFDSDLWLIELDTETIEGLFGVVNAE